MRINRSIGLVQAFFAAVAMLALMPDHAAAMKVGDRTQDRARLTFATADGGRHDIEIFGFSHEVVSPRDAASGLPTGKRQHKPFTIIKPVDKSSPLLMNILTNNENVTEWHMEVYRVGPGNRSRLVKTVDLLGPSVCGVANTLSPEKAREEEHVSFCYQKIIWTFEEGGISAEDDWETPLS